MNSTRMIDDERDTPNSEEREKSRNSNLHLVIKVFFQFFLTYFTVWQFSRLSEQIHEGIISLSNDLFDPLVYIRSVFVVGLLLLALTYFLLPSNLKELVKLLLQAYGKIQKLENDREDLSVRHQEILRYAMINGAQNINHIISQAHVALQSATTKKYSIGSLLPGGGPWTKEEAEPVIQSIRLLSPIEIEALNSNLYAYWYSLSRSKNRSMQLDYEYIKDSEIDKPLLDEVSQILGIIPSEKGYSIRPNNFGNDWLVEVGDKTIKDVVETRDTKEEAENCARKLAETNNLPFQGIWGRRYSKK